VDGGRFIARSVRDKDRRDRSELGPDGAGGDAQKRLVGNLNLNLGGIRYINDRLLVRS
jgi:hypothetical protein